VRWEGTDDDGLRLYDDSWEPVNKVQFPDTMGELSAAAIAKRGYDEEMRSAPEDADPPAKRRKPRGAGGAPSAETGVGSAPSRVMPARKRAKVTRLGAEDGDPGPAVPPRPESDLEKLRRWLRDTHRPLGVALRIVAGAGAGEDAESLALCLKFAARAMQVGGADANEVRTAALAALKMLPAGLSDAVRASEEWSTWGGTSPDANARAAAWACLNRGYGGLSTQEERSQSIADALAAHSSDWGGATTSGGEAGSAESDEGYEDGAESVSEDDE